MKILAIIPARSGSKSVKNKNIRLINDKPMLAYSIEHAKESKYINRILVSTDSEEYAKIAREYGAQTPFIRPAKYATDLALDIDVFEHALHFLEEEEGYVPDLVVQLRPTYPVRNVEDIDKIIEMMLADQTIDSVRTMALSKEVAHKMWYKDENNIATPIMTDIPECYNMPRQDLPKVYFQNGNIDAVRPEVITKQHSMSGKKIIGYEMTENFDIDTEEDFARVAEYLKIKGGGKRFVFDIDGVIALSMKNLDYAQAEPNTRMIDIINKLYTWGNEIILFTARGYVTGIDWRETTEKQMKKWGICYHELHFGKPNADYYIDDKMLDMKFLYEEF